jgi:thiol reductant ABC exporter CydD subunit
MRGLDRRLLGRARGARVLLVVDTALGIGSAALVLVQATLLATVVARLFDGASPRAVTPELALLVLTFAGRGLLAWSFEVAGNRAASTVLSDLRLSLVERRLRAQPAALDGVEGGEVAAAAVQGIDALRSYFGRYLPQVLLAAIVPIAVLARVATIDLDSALLMLLTLPVVPLFMWLIGRYTQDRTRAHWLALRLLSTHFLDVVRGLPTLRAYNRSRAQGATLEDVGDRYRRTAIATLRVGFLSGAVLELASTLAVALVAVTIGVRLIDGGIALQAGLTVLVLAPELYAPLRQLGAEFHASADGLAVADRILELLDAPPEVRVAHAGFRPAPTAGPIRFEQVSFSYPSRPEVVLDRLELELLEGETVALVGRSGSGKSTVASLLLRFAEPGTGRILVGGRDLAECCPDEWRRSVAWVPQRPTIFAGTVLNNICLGAPGAPRARARESALLAGADRFIAALPDGYDTVVGDGGRPLSAGERRRIALARAFLRDAPFVILDEPTADLDRVSADVVAEAVERLCHGRTVLLIAHPAELAQRADRVVSLDSRAAAARDEAA